MPVWAKNRNSVKMSQNYILVILLYFIKIPLSNFTDFLFFRRFTKIN